MTHQKTIDYMLNLCKVASKRLKKPVSVDVEAWCFASGDTEAQVRVYVSDIVHQKFDTLPEAVKLLNALVPQEEVANGS